MESEVDIANYLKLIKKSINDGLESDYEVNGDIDIELAVINKKTASGGIRIFLANVNGKYSKEHLSKIKFKIRPKTANNSDILEAINKVHG